MLNQQGSRAGRSAFAFCGQAFAHSTLGVGAATLLTLAPVWAQEQQAPAREVRTIRAAKRGFPTPAGIAYLPAAKAFLTLPAHATPGVPGSELNAITSGGDLHGFVRMATAIRNPLNLVHDAKANRLLILDSVARELSAIPVRPDGSLDPARRVRYGTEQLGAVDPQGLAVDPASGRLFIFDRGGPWLLRVEPDAQGGFASAAVTSVDLSRLGLAEPRGLAFDRTSGHLHVLTGPKWTLSELTEEGELVATRDLSGVRLFDPRGMVFAPSGDMTDDPATLSLYLADAGRGAPQASAKAAPNGTSPRDAAARPSGGIVELSLTAALLPAAAAFTSNLVATTLTSSFDPPSPDPSGIEYVPALNTLWIGDGEVDEMSIFENVQVWETTLAGSVVSTHSVLSFSDEPVGVAVNPGNQHLFYSDDTGSRRVYEVNPGPDTLYHTADDIVTSFGTSAYGNGDPEGVAYDSADGVLFIADGVNREVYRVSPGPNGIFNGVPPTGDDVVTHFDTLVLGIDDPEGIAVNGDNGHLYIVGKPGTVVAEITKAGALFEMIDTSAANARKPAGLAYGPSSVGPGKSLYIVARGVDNDSNPNENDGRMYEVSLPDRPPIVNAGLDQSVNLPAPVVLDGTVSDDGMPAGPLATTWSFVSGPGSVAFGDASAVDTIAVFSVEGIYTLRLTANDGAVPVSDDVVITVGPAGSPTFTLGVSRDGTGTGTVSSSPVGIACGGACSTPFNSGAVVDLTATADASSTFTGWGGACAGTGACQVTMDAAKSVTATFTLQSFTLSVTKNGTGTGTVSSTPAGISCGGTCSALFDFGTLVNLTAVTDAGSTFTGWGGACSGTGACQVTMDAAKSVTATFTLQSFTLSVTKNGTGTGTVSSTPAGISCGATCSSPFNFGTVVNLTATADASSTFTGWGGACSGTGACQVTMDAAKSVTATFTAQQGTFTLSVTKNGTGTGTVSSTPAGISCGATCSSPFNSGTVVNLTATADASSTFSGWGGACSGSGTCQVTMDAAKSVTASFALQGGSVITFEKRVAASTDDAEQNPSTGAVDLTSSDIELVLDGGVNQVVGLRITGVTIPQGAAILNAWVQFKVDEVGSTATAVNVQGQAADNALTFTTAANNVGSRPRTVASVNWVPPAWTVVGEAGLGQRTPNLASVIQEIVSRPGWASGNALALIVTGTGKRTAESFNGDAAGAALLHVEYGSGGGGGNLAPSVNAGPDQTITLPASANLDGTVTDDGLPTPPSVTTSWTMLSGSGTVTFGNASAVDTTATFSTSGVYTLRLAATDGAAASFDDVVITVNNAGGTITFEKRVAASADDAEQNLATGAVDLTSSDIELVLDGSVSQVVGLRFTGVTIPQGATIANAWVQFKVDETGSTATSVNVQGQADDNALTFTTAANSVGSRPRTAATVNWVPPAWTVVGQAGPGQQTPNLASVIQEIVSRPGWVSGNALALIVTGSGKRTAESFNGDAAGAALLHVEYAN